METLLKMLEQRGLEKLPSFLVGSNSYIAGSFTVEAYLRYERLSQQDKKIGWKSNDVDIWVDKETDTFVRLIAFLYRNGFHWPSLMGEMDGNRINSSTYSYINGDDNLLEVLQMVGRRRDAKNSRAIVQIILCDNPLQHIKNFDIRLCSLATNGVKIVNPSDELEQIIDDLKGRSMWLNPPVVKPPMDEKGQINNEVYCNRMTQRLINMSKRFQKYTNRGFNTYYTESILDFLSYFPEKVFKTAASEWNKNARLCSGPKIFCSKNGTSLWIPKKHKITPRQYWKGDTPNTPIFLIFLIFPIFLILRRISRRGAKFNRTAK
jgi:hypothetical protein